MSERSGPRNRKENHLENIFRRIFFHFRIFMGFWLENKISLMSGKAIYRSSNKFSRSGLFLSAWTHEQPNFTNNRFQIESS